MTIWKGRAPDRPELHQDPAEGDLQEEWLNAPAVPGYLQVPDASDAPGCLAW